MTFTRSHAPLGYDRLYSLFLDSFYSTTPIYRHIPNFLAQFGISTSSKLNEKWGWPNTIPDDPWVPGFHRFTRGSISFAGSGPDSRTTDIFICLMETGGSLGANKGNSPWEVPVGRVIEGMNVVERFYSGYGDVDAFNPGKGISQQKLRNRGEEYVNADFPLISRFTTCEIEVVDGNLFGDRAKTENSKRKQEMIEREKNRDVDKGGRFNKWDVEKLSKNARMIRGCPASTASPVVLYPLQARVLTLAQLTSSSALWRRAGALGRTRATALGRFLLVGLLRE